MSGNDMVSGYELVAETVRAYGIDDCYFLMGGPTIDLANEMERLGTRMVDVRHEQAAVMMAHSSAILRQRVALAMCCSGPGFTNTLTGIANAYADGVPVVVLGGSSRMSDYGRGGFQELDQVRLAEPVTTWSVRVQETRRIPDILSKAFARALGPSSGPVYVDLPGDVLYGKVSREDVLPVSAYTVDGPLRSLADADAVREAAELIAAAERPVVIAGNGALWSEAGDVLQKWLNDTGIPVYVMPQARGLIPEDHEFALLEARSSAFREADLVIVAGAPLNYATSRIQPPRFKPDVKVVQIDNSASELGSSRHIDVPLLGDVRSVISQLHDAYLSTGKNPRHEDWTNRLKSVTEEKRSRAEQADFDASSAMHPIELCRVVRDFLDRDAILCVDGQEILTYARQTIPTFYPGHRLNSGTLGTMGVGLPFGVGAKATRPDKQVVVLHGDGSFGMNAMEFDTAVRHNLPVITVISNNGGWTATDRYKAGRELGYSRYDLMAEALGGHGEFVEKIEDLLPALTRAAESGVPSVVNVITDKTARATTMQFTRDAT
jgi:acetolactate synthase-1/2/3 large subunit